MIQGSQLLARSDIVDLRIHPRLKVDLHESRGVAPLHSGADIEGIRSWDRPL